MNILEKAQSAFKAWKNPQLFNNSLFYELGNNFGWGTKSLEKIEKEGYELNIYVYFIINKIAEAAAGIPIKVKQINSKGEEEEVFTGGFYDFVHEPNNEEEYSTQMFNSIVYQLLLGNTIQRKVIPVGFNAAVKRFNLAPQYIKQEIEKRFKWLQADKIHLQLQFNSIPLFT